MSDRLACILCADGLVHLFAVEPGDEVDGKPAMCGDAPKPEKVAADNDPMCPGCSHASVAWMRGAN